MCRGAAQSTPRWGPPIEAPCKPPNQDLQHWASCYKSLGCEALRVFMTPCTRPATTNLTHRNNTFYLTVATNVIRTALAPEAILSTSLPQTDTTWFQRQPRFETVNALASPIFRSTFVAMPLASHSLQSNSWPAVVEASAAKLIATSSTAPEMILLVSATTAKPTAVFLFWIGAGARRRHPALQQATKKLQQS